MDTTGQKPTIQKEDLFRFKFLADAKLSPDGQTVAYVVLSTDAQKNEDHAAIWLLSIQTGETRQLTSGLTRDGAPEWSPDGRQIAFTSGRSGKGQIHVIPVDGGEARQLTTLEQGVGGGAAWSPDGKWIAFTAGPEKPPIDPNLPYRVSRALYRFDGIGYLDNAIQDIYVIPTEGGEAKRLVHDECMNTGPKWSPDGKLLLFSKAFQPDRQSAFMPELAVVDLEGQQRTLTDGWGWIFTAAWIPASKKFVFIGGPKERIPVATKSDVWVMDVESGSIDNRTPSSICPAGAGLQGDMPAEPPSIVVFDDKNNAYVSFQVGGTVPVYRVALSGPEDVAPVLTGDRSIRPLGIASGKILYAADSCVEPPDLYMADLNGSGERRLSQLNADLLSGVDLPTVTRLLFKGVDGASVEGWYLRPARGEAPYPTVLYIHGGPHSGFGHVFSLDFQMLCGAGFGVLAINHRGSTGYGDEFSTKIIGDWGNLDYQDLMSGVDYAITKGLADPDRLGCCGISGGGNLSTWIVGHTDRFKAAVPENPVTNMLSEYGVSDLGVWLSRMETGGDPHEVMETYLRCSPIVYAHNCKTPTLLLQGESDYRCPAEQSEQFYAALKAHGCVVEMVRFPGSPHVGSIMGPVPIRKAQNEALLGWMKKYLLGIE